MNRLDLIAEVTSAAFTHYSDHTLLAAKVSAQGKDDTKVNVEITVEVPLDQMMTLRKVEQTCLAMALSALREAGAED